MYSHKQEKSAGHQHDFRDLFLIRPMHWCFECISVIQCCYVLSKSRFSKVAAPLGKTIFGYLVFHAHSAPHYFLFFVISEPRKQFKPRINNGSCGLLFYFRFLGSRWRIAFTQGLRRRGRNGFRLRMIGIFTDTYTSAFISSRIFLKSFESCQKSLSLLNFRLFFFFFFFFCVASLSLVRQTIGSTAKDAQKRNSASESDVTYASSCKS